jgi:hypothetical protein
MARKTDSSAAAQPTSRAHQINTSRNGNSDSSTFAAIEKA